MYFLYSLTLALLSLALLPYFIYQSIRHGKYAGSFRQRMGRLPPAVGGDGRPTLWVHTVSVGEFNAARPLLANLRETLPDYRLVVSTTTLTGQRLARDARPGLLDAVFYFPFDWVFTVRRALDRVNPEAVVILETELWPNFLRECRRRGVPTLIANGRISPRSFARYLWVRWFMGRVLNTTTLLLMQSEADAERAHTLGADPDRVRVCGNLKYDLAVADSSPPQSLDQLFALSSSPRLLVAGSTAPGEEGLVIEALRGARKVAGLEDTRLLIAPRRPERFDEVAALLEQSGFRYARRSQAQNDGKAADIILLDTIGELAQAYRFAAVVFVGGSLVPRGGHNIIEPAAYAKAVVVGPHTENFRQVISDFARADAVAQVGDGESFAGEVIRLLTDREAAQAMGKRAYDLLSQSRGATGCTVSAIRDALGMK